MIDIRATGRIPDALGHQDRYHILFGVRIPGSAVAAVPAVPSGNRCQIVAPGDHGHAETPPVVVPEAGKEIGRRFLLGRDMVSRHQLDREPRQDALAPMLPLVQHQWRGATIQA